MATEAFVIAITTTGTREVQRDLNNIGSTGSAASKALDTVGPAAARAQRSVDALSGSLGFMRNLLVAFSFVRAISGFAEFASTATQLDNKLTTITRNAEETRQVLAALGETSIRTRTDLEANVDTFVRMARSTGSLKLSYTQLIDLTRAIADTVHIAGASTAQAKRALMDFAEGLAAGSLQGRQLRAMIMQLPTLGDAIAKSFGLAGAQLMEFLKQHPGSLTPVAIIKSLQAALPGLDAMIGKTQVTIGQAFTNMETKALLFFDAMDHVYGISSKVNDILTYVSDHIGAIVKFIGLLAGIGALTVLVGIITALITNFGFLFSIINFLTGGLLKLAVALIALPFTIVATGIELMTAAWSIFMVVTEAVMGIMSGLQAVFAVLTSGFDLYIVFASLFTTLVEMIPLLIGMVVTLGAIAAAALVAGTAIYGLILPLAQLGTFGGAIDGLKLSIKDIPGVFEAAFNTVVDNFPLVTKAISTLWDDMVNSMLNKIGNLGNETIQVGIDALNPAGAAARMITGEKSNVSVFDTGRPTNNAQPILNDLAGKFRGNVLKNVLGLRMGEDSGTPASPSLLGNTPVVQQGRDLGDSGKGADKFAAAQTALQNFLAQFAPYAQVLAKVDEFNKLITKSTKAHVNVLHELALAGISANSIEDARAKLLVLVQRNTLGVGNEDLKAAQQTVLLDDAVKKHIITMNEYADALLKVHQAQLSADPSNMALGIKVAGETAAKNLRDKGTLADSVVGGALSFQNQPQIAANSVEALNAALADGTIQAPAYHHAMMDILKDQRDLASGEALAALKAQDELLNQAAIAASTLDGVYSAFNGGAKLAIQLQAINDAMAKNPALVNEGTKAIRDLESAYLSTQTDALSGFQKGLLDAQKTMNDFASDASKAVTDAFNNLSDTLTTFFSTGKFSIKKFADDMLADLDRLAVKQVFMAPLANALGFDQSGQGGAAGSGGILQSIFGGTGLGGALSGQLGTLANPMYVKSADALLGGAGIPGMGGASSGGLGDIFSKGGFFSNLFNGGGGAGFTSSGILSALTDVGSFLGFAGGGDMVIGGQGGTDSQNIKFKATPGEVVSVRRPGDSDEGFGGGSPTVVHMHVHGVQDVDGFQRSQGQIASSLASQLGRSQMRNKK